ncbi:chromate transporter [Gemmobacter lanyuensis]
MGLSWLYALFGDVAVVSALFFGLKAAVLAIVLQAVVRVGRRALKSGVMRGIAAASFVSIFAFGAPFPLIVAGAALIGWFGGKAGLAGFKGAVMAPRAARMWRMQRRFWEPRLPFPFGPAWRDPGGAGGVDPVAFAGRGACPSGAGQCFYRHRDLFLEAGGADLWGAYAVLAWVAQEAVGTYGWLKPGEMLDGLGMAETTPGPLIMVLQFVGFMGALREAGWAMPLLAGTAGGLLTTWVTFAPCFAWIFLGAPSWKGCAKTAPFQRPCRQ